MKADQLVCERDGAATRLRCAGCGTGICPACLVRTPVGHKCPSCAGDTPPARRRSWVGPAVIAGLALVAALVVAMLLRASGEGSSDPVAVATPAGAEAPATRQAMIGEEVRDGQLVFVVDDFGCQPREGQGAGKVCTLRFNVKNASGAPALLLGRFQYLVDGQRRSYGADEALTRAVPENGNRGLSEINVNPEVVVPLVFVYELPESVEPTEAQFRGTGRSRFGVNVRLQHRP
ncbi:MAG TPA: hypothetical protein VHF27_01605 [Acidimicrobiales bacterium]|nr:hypothetical protein [Acidimicrobiales bacterium]